eukprot:gene25745-31494_t
MAINQCYSYICALCDRTKIMSVNIQNIVTYTKFKGKVDLMRMFEENGLHTIYNPELFPGLRMSLHKQNARASIFFQGNAIVTGCNNFALVENLWDIVEHRTQPYLKHDTASTAENSLVKIEKITSSNSLKVYSSDNLTHNYTAMNRQIERLLYCNQEELNQVQELCDS